MTDDDARPDDAMTGAELRCIAHTLGLSRDHLARLLRVQPRTVERWLYGQRPAPPGVVSQVRTWLRAADDELSRMIADHDAEPARVVVTYRDDGDHMTAAPGSRMPSSWHRALVARLMAARPSVRVDYAP